MTHQHDHCAVTCTAFGDGNGLQFFHQQGVVGRIVRRRAGKTRAVNAWCTIEGVDLDAGIVGERGQPGHAGSMARLDDCVFDKGGSGFGDLANFEIGLRLQLIAEIVKYCR